MPVFMNSRVISKSPPSFFVTNFIRRVASLMVLLRSSCNCSYYVSRRILPPQPDLPNLLEHFVGEFVKLILLYTFLCPSVCHSSHKSLSLCSFFPLFVWVGGYFLLNIDSVILIFFFVDLSPLIRRFVVYSTDQLRFTLYCVLHCV
jgi:hypothetical protein